MALKLNYNIFNFILNNFIFIKWNYKNILPVIIQEILTKNILMFAWFNNYSFLKTILFLFVFYYSRSRFNLWFKGFWSFNFQFLKYFYFDCDMDCFLIKILQLNKKSCHTKNFFCFFNKFL